MIKEKRCGRCGETKSIKRFYKHKGKQDGYTYHCKVCVKENSKAYSYSDKGKEVRKQYTQSDIGKQVRRRYNQSEKRKQSAKKYSRSKGAKQSRERYIQSIKGKEAARKDTVIRRTRKTQGGGSYTIDEWYNLCKFYDFHCLKCNKKFPFEKLTVDHIKPVSKGGSSFIWNLQPLCKRCNISKHNREIDYRKAIPDWINRDGSVWQQDSLF